MFLLIDNYDSFTHNLRQAFLLLGHSPVVIKNDDPLLLKMAADPALAMVCISPGPGRPEQAGFCLDFLAALPHTIPVLGICLGHQILGSMAGARIRLSQRIMHGKQASITHDSTGIFRGIASPMMAGRYHSLVVCAEDTPELLEVTASCTAQDGSREVMAFRYKDRPWAGVQFHPESVLTPEGMRLLANFPSGLYSPNTLPFNGATPHSASRHCITGHCMSGNSASDNSVSGSIAPVQMSMVIERLARGEDLETDVALAVFSRLMDGELSASQMGALLLGLRAKGETPEEVSAAALAILARAVPVPPIEDDCIDIVGTGGDNKFSFNCSTATALTLAGMGYKVLKHGNRSVSSRCGSADVLEKLGVPLDIQPESVPESLRSSGFVFLFAPRFHPAFKNVMPVRRELGVRTIFNMLGPLVNPAIPKCHFLGVPDKSQLPLLGQALARISNGRGAIVTGAGGYDELSTLGSADLLFIENGVTRAGTLNPAEYGFKAHPEHQLAVEGPEHAATVMRELLTGSGPQAMSDMLALNVGFALYLLKYTPGSAYDEPCGYDKALMRSSMLEARAAVAQGAGRRFCNA